MRRRLMAVTALVGMLVVAPSAVANAAFPGAKGRIAFEQGGVIYTIRPDGSDRVRLTPGTQSHGPRWSPDGSSIVFHRAGDIWAMAADGSNEHRITFSAAGDINPAWAPDGTQVVFSRSTDGTLEGRSLWVAPATGGHAHRLTSAADGCPVEPTWSADGRFVVYWDKCPGPAYSSAIRKVNLATGAVSTVVPASGIPQSGGSVTVFGSGPDVSPDGTKVVFTAENQNGDCGVGVVNITGPLGFRFVTTPIDCIFSSDDPAVSPDGRSVVYTGGNENPQLDVVALSSTTGYGRLIYASNTGDFPLRADWQPRP